MAGKSNPRSALQKLLKARPETSKAFHSLYDRRRYDDRAAALVASTLLEHALEEAISGHFAPIDPNDIRRLFEGDNEREGTLGSFYAKIWLAYALGVFGKQILDDLNMIRHIRNVFAHSPIDVTFDTPDIGGACQFHFIDMLFPRDSSGGGIIGARPDTPRHIFLYVASMLSSILSVYGPRQRLSQALSVTTDQLLLTYRDLLF